YLSRFAGFAAVVRDWLWENWTIKSVYAPRSSRRPGSDFRMPHYFFNTRIGNELLLDPEGEELRDADQAWHVARTTIREILASEGEQANLLSAVLEVT